jgi:two-component system response regulator
MIRNDHIILLVEDNADEAELTLRAFKKSNIPNELVVVGDGEEALDYLFATGAYAGRDRTVKPHLVLLDLKLPRITGLEVLRRIRADPKTKLFPVIILTTSSEEADVIGGYELGANSYVRKPVNFEQFTDAALQLGLYWLGLNVPPPAHRRGHSTANRDDLL